MLSHARTGPDNALQIILGCGVQTLLMLVQQQPTKTLYAAQWCAQVMGDRILQFFQFAFQSLDLDPAILIRLVHG